jgi:transposase InsO family protein
MAALIAARRAQDGIPHAVACRALGGRAPDLVRRDFPATGINTKWYGDGTGIPTGEGKLYLASVLDMASRRVLGFALGEHHNAQLASGALAMAVAVRGGQVPGVIMHTHQGSRVHLRHRPRGLPAAGHPPADGQARVRAGQRGHRVLAPGPGVGVALREAGTTKISQSKCPRFQRNRNSSGCCPS